MIHIVKQKVSDRRTLRALMVRPFLLGFSDGLTEILSKHNVSSIHETSAVIHNKMALASPARERKDSSFGRFLNLLTSDDPDYIVLTGFELKGLLHYAEETADAEVVRELGQQPLHGVDGADAEEVHRGVVQLHDRDAALLVAVHRRPHARDEQRRVAAERGGGRVLRGDGGGGGAQRQVRGEPADPPLVLLVGHDLRAGSDLGWATHEFTHAHEFGRNTKP